MSCQKDIAAKIINKGADYIFALKGNQPTMEAKVKVYFDNLPQDRIEMSKIATWTSPAEKEHGRIESRSVTTASCDWFMDRMLWKNLSCFVRVTRTVTKQNVRAILYQ